MKIQNLLNALKNCSLSSEEQEAVCKLQHGDLGEDKEYYLCIYEACKKRNLLKKCFEECNSKCDDGF